MDTKLAEFQRLARENMESSLSAAAALSGGLQTVAAEFSENAKKLVESTTVHMQKLSSASSLEAAIAVQTDFAKQQSELFAAQAARMSDIYTKLASGAFKSVDR